jgi:hypothetical protein
MDNEQLATRANLIYKMRNDGMVYRLIGTHFGITEQRARWIYEKRARRIRIENERKTQEQ